VTRAAKYRAFKYEGTMKALVDVDPLLDGVYRIEDGGSCSSVYVIAAAGTLIDTGNMYGLVDELHDLGFLGFHKKILLTHGHFDHVGGVEEIFQVASPEIYLHPIAREHLRLLRDPFPAFFDALERDGKLISVNDGDPIDGLPALTVIHAPGHTAGDLCFFDSRSGALFSGDAVLPSNCRAGTMLSQPDSGYGGSLEDRLNSLRRLLALRVTHLLPGHGQPVFHKGGDQIKISLYGFYQRLYKSCPERAWIEVAKDLFEAGVIEDARQCAAKAFQISPSSIEVRELLDKLTLPHRRLRS